MLHKYSYFEKVTYLRFIQTTSLFCILVFVSFQANAQGPGWDWAQNADCSGEDYPRAILTDAMGNSFITGTFEGSISMDTTIVSNGLGDAYLAKIAPNGDVIWLTNVGGSNNETGLSLALDNSGNVFLGGVFNSPSMIVGQDTLYSNSWYHDALFVVKFSSSGVPIWARYSTGPGTQGDLLYGLSCDNHGNIYGAGFFKSSTISFGTFTLTNMGDNDILMFCLDPNGDPLWANGYGSSDLEYGFRLDISDNGLIYLAGMFQSDTLSFGSIDLVNAGGRDAFLAKFKSDGTPLWAKQSNGTDDEDFLAIDFDDTHNRVVTGGRFKGTAIFDSQSFSSKGDFDMCVVVYDSLGNALWYENKGTDLYDDARAVATFNIGDIMVGGTFEGDTIDFGIDKIENQGGKDIYLARYNSFGNLHYVKGIGGTGDEGDVYVSHDDVVSCFVLGAFVSPVLQFDAITLSNPGGRTNFMAKISTGIIGEKEHAFKNESFFYPNPSKDGYFVIDNASLRKSINAYEVYDLEGRLILKSRPQILDDFKVIIQIENPGYYLVKLEFEDGTNAVERIVYLQ